MNMVGGCDFSDAQGLYFWTFTYTPHLLLLLLLLLDSVRLLIIFR